MALRKQMDADGSIWQVCIHCGKIGQENTFFGKMKLFCSAKCSQNHLNQFSPNAKSDPVIRRYSTNLMFVPLCTAIQRGRLDQLDQLSISFNRHEFAPVDAFVHAPLSDVWEELSNNNVIVDIRRPHDTFFWRARIIKSSGYFLHLNYLGDFPESTFITNIRLRNLLPVPTKGAAHRAYLPPSIMSACKSINVDSLPPNACTLEKDIYSTFEEDFKEKFDTDILYETIDQEDPSRFLTCKILFTFGDWLYVQYQNINFKADPVWVHPKSGFFRITGWCQWIGYPMYTTPTYSVLSLFTLSKCPTLITQYLTNPDALPHEPNLPNTFPVGSYLEFLDPFTHVMKVAKVNRILRFGFMVLDYDIESIKPKQIIQHITSPVLFPFGYSRKNKIRLYLFENMKLDFDKEKAISSTIVPESCFIKQNVTNKFQEGMMLETFNLVQFGLISYAIVFRVVDQLINLRFMSKVNLDPAYECWAHCQSPNIRPFGYVHLMKLDPKKIGQYPIFIENFRFTFFHNKITQLKRLFQIKPKNNPLVVRIQNGNKNFKQLSINKILKNNNDKAPRKMLNIPETLNVRYSLIQNKFIKTNQNEDVSCNRNRLIINENINIPSKNEQPPTTGDVRIIDEDEDDEDEDYQEERRKWISNKGYILPEDIQEELKNQSEDAEPKKLFLESIHKALRYFNFDDKQLNLDGLEKSTKNDVLSWKPEELINCISKNYKKFLLSGNHTKQNLETNSTNDVKYLNELQAFVEGNINGKRFFQMTYEDLFEKISSSHPFIMALTLFKIALIQHFQLDEDNIFNESTPSRPSSPSPPLGSSTVKSRENDTVIGTPSTAQQQQHSVGFINIMPSSSNDKISLTSAPSTIRILNGKIVQQTN